MAFLTLNIIEYPFIWNFLYQNWLLKLGALKWTSKFNSNLLKFVYQNIHPIIQVLWAPRFAIYLALYIAYLSFTCHYLYYNPAVATQCSQVINMLPTWAVFVSFLCPCFSINLDSFLPFFLFQHASNDLPSHHQIFSDLSHMHLWRQGEPCCYSNFFRACAFGRFNLSFRPLPEQARKGWHWESSCEKS